MSPEWYRAIRAIIPRPRGSLAAMQAVERWCGASSDDQRLSILTTSLDDERGGHLVGRALRAGGWDGTGLDELAAALADDHQTRVQAFSPMIVRISSGRGV